MKKRELRSQSHIHENQELRSWSLFMKRRTTELDLCHFYDGSAALDKILLYSSRMQTTCTRKHNEPSQESYLVAMLVGVFL